MTLGEMIHNLGYHVVFRVTSRQPWCALEPYDYSASLIFLEEASFEQIFSSIDIPRVVKHEGLELCLLKCLKFVSYVLCS